MCSYASMPFASPSATGVLLFGGGECQVYSREGEHFTCSLLSVRLHSDPSACAAGLPWWCQQSSYPTREKDRTRIPLNAELESLSYMGQGIMDTCHYVVPPVCVGVLSHIQLFATP